MKKHLFTVVYFVCAFAFNSTAQINYVLNGSLEQYTSCPGNYNEIKNAKYWSGIDTSNAAGTPGVGCVPEYCNMCSTNLCCAVPANNSFNHSARTGKAMAEVTMYFHKDDTDSHPIEYLQGRLYNHLTAGRTYCITFYTCFTGSNTLLRSGFAVDHIGAFADNGTIDTTTALECVSPLPAIIPQVYTTSIISDSVNWTKIQGSFVASGNERFITIGNFFDTTVTHYINYNPPGPQLYDYAWYLVDDVSIIDNTQKAFAGNDTVINRGDSVFIGSHEDGLPVTWYRLGTSTPLTIAGGLWVKPDTTTHYVVKLDLCSGITYDTMKVQVGRTGVTSLHAGQSADVQLFPNPASASMTITNAAGGNVVFYDMVGRKVKTIMCTQEREWVDIKDLSRGVYTVDINLPPALPGGSGLKMVKKLVKE
jgi:hypothetical protein